MNRVALAIGVAALFSAATARADNAGPVWAIRKDAGTVYLAGSVHVLDTARNQLPQGFDTAYADAERLVMELDLDDLDPAAAATYLGANAMFEDGENLRTLLGPERFARIDSEARGLGLPLDSVQQLEPWAVALALTQLQMVKLGLDAEQGVEQQLERRARADGKPIAGLETIDEQLAVLDGLSYADQARFLELTVEEGDTIAAELDKMLAAWRRADTASLERLLLDEYDKMPTLYRPLVTDRNRRWLPQIEALLARKDDTLVVVGALHLVGPDGLLALLTARGLTPTQVGATPKLTPP